jgi:hypothetical protein
MNPGRTSRGHRAIAVGVCLLLVVRTALADVTAQDLQIAARALSFLQKPLSGEVAVGIVYVRGNPQSLEEAESLQRMLNEGLKVGNITLKSTLVSLEQAPRASVGLFFLTTGLGAEAQSLAVISHAKHLPCLTTDLSQVAAGRCAVGVRSQPKIEIVVNRMAATASATTFSTVFRMMITEM